jgi:hypothetical protein
MNRISRWLWPMLFLLMTATAASASAQAPAPFKKEEIEQLVAPIALYPDSLIAQILMASTYALEIVSAARWVKANPNVKDKALEDALQKEPWDPSVKSLTAFPQVLAMMNDKLDMTQRLGDAFLGQQKEVLAAIQQLRAKAQAAGNLKSGKEQTVSTAQEAGTTVIKIEPAQPSVVYVPTYNPTVVYGPWPYAAYPPYYYYPPGYTAAAAVFTFAAGVAIGNALWGNCNWGHGDVNVNVNRYNSFNRTSIQNTNWQHNVEHRKGVQYRDSASQQRYGRGQSAGAASREAFRGRAETGRQDIARGGAEGLKADRAGDRSAGIEDRGGERARGADDRAGKAGDRAGASDRSSGIADRAGSGPVDRAGSGPVDRAGSGPVDRAGSGSVDRAGAGPAGRGDVDGSLQRTGGRQADAFQGMGNGSQTRDFSSRGAQSRGGGGARGGGRR